jgi:hypothetical protein
MAMLAVGVVADFQEPMLLEPTRLMHSFEPNNSEKGILPSMFAPAERG